MRGSVKPHSSGRKESAPRLWITKRPVDNCAIKPRAWYATPASGVLRMRRQDRLDLRPALPRLPAAGVGSQRTNPSASPQAASSRLRTASGTRSRRRGSQQGPRGVWPQRFDDDPDTDAEGRLDVVEIERAVDESQVIAQRVERAGQVLQRWPVPVTFNGLGV